VGILTSSRNIAPNIVLDNTNFKNVDRIVQVDGGSTLLSGNDALWATGKRYNGSEGTTETGHVTAPAKGKALLDSNGKLYVRSRPQYEDIDASGFVVATTDGGCKNDGSGDQTTCISKGEGHLLPSGYLCGRWNRFRPHGIQTAGLELVANSGWRLLFWRHAGAQGHGASGQRG
jgi:hypothetical protein